MSLTATFLGWTWLVNICFVNFFFRHTCFYLPFGVKPVWKAKLNQTINSILWIFADFLLSSTPLMRYFKNTKQATETFLTSIHHLSLGYKHSTTVRLQKNVMWHIPNSPSGRRARTGSSHRLITHPAQVDIISRVVADSFFPPVSLLPIATVLTLVPYVYHHNETHALHTDTSFEWDSTL